MSFSDRIKDEAVVDTIAALIEDNTLVRVKFVESNAERICIINSQRPIAETPYFQIDLPEDIPLPADEENWRIAMAFDFMGRDRLNYSFKAAGGIIIGDKLWVKLPREIERVQQRNNFRIETPKRSFLELTLAKKRYSLILENISLGGAYCRARRSLKSGLIRLPVEKDSGIEELRLVIPTAEKSVEIYVQHSRIARIVKDPDKRLLAYGIEFIEVGREEKARLTRIIYDLQRQFLKRRLK